LDLRTPCSPSKSFIFARHNRATILFRIGHERKGTARTFPPVRANPDFAAQAASL
jgi:hypothetical protein